MAEESPREGEPQSALVEDGAYELIRRRLREQAEGLRALRDALRAHPEFARPDASESKGSAIEKAQLAFWLGDHDATWIHARGPVSRSDRGLSAVRYSFGAQDLTIFQCRLGRRCAG